MASQKTTVAKPANVKRTWYLYDAAEAPVGRLATEIARKLTGKDKVDYTPHVDAGDYVVVINAADLVVTGKKPLQKRYYSHSGYTGNLKEETLEQRMNTNPAKVIEGAVYGMLPKNKQRAERMKRLNVVVGAEHPHEGQKPQKVEVK